jgi:hypothetical protein
MSKVMAITEIEQQIEELPPVEQAMMLERIARHLKRMLLAQTNLETTRAERTGIAEKLNQIYQTEASRLDPLLIYAQCSSVNSEEW